jgi:serine/threonine protein kinase
MIPSKTNDSSLAGLLRACGGYTTEAGLVIGRGRPILVEPVQRIVFRQIVEAVNVLHVNGIVHKDIKAENVLVDSNLNVQLIDFGHAAFYRNDKNTNIRPFRSYGTPLFCPPEVRSGMTFVGPEADVYALGLMLYEMNYGDLPDNLEEVRVSTFQETPFETSFRTGFFTEEIRHLCRWMLQPNPAQRPSLRDVLCHPWLN